MKSGDLYCKAVAFKDFPDFIRRLNGSPEKLFSQCELNMSHALRGNNFYQWGKVCRLLELAANELNEPHLGLKWAYETPQDFLNTGPMLLLGALMPSIRDFADLGIEYQKLHTNGVIYRYLENETKKELEFEAQFHPLTPPCRQYSEHIMAIPFLMERHHFGKGKFTKVTFQHNAPADISWHEKIFQCQIEFNADKTAAYTSTSFLEIKIDGRLKGLRPVVKMYLDRKVSANPIFDTSIAQTVESLLPTVFGMRKSDMKHIADILGISPKKLQRLLSEEGTTFSNILGTVRKGMAKRLLFESDILISHLAISLDYSSTEAFNTACQRWFGVSPSQYREDMRAPAR